MLDHKTRYLQIAFNYDIALAKQILSKISFSERILIEAGTPFIKREGIDGIKTLRSAWKGYIVADKHQMCSR
jgi:3-keto-L-gulonate-6-phosphate decarboxylase